MQDTFKRYFKIFLGAVGALLTGSRVASGLKNGYVFGIGQTILGTAYQKATQASQYWFIIFFWSVACASCLWLAWSSYRE
jgi:hypothetical protein